MSHLNCATLLRIANTRSMQAAGACLSVKKIGSFNTPQHLCQLYKKWRQWVFFPIYGRLGAFISDRSLQIPWEVTTALQLGSPFFV
jgi:hypothetical protein